ncbi:hypothetical protein [Pseudomonas sp. I2]|uniref:hypothetical protein n=1 Tax=unclassified Pseudomonas TaxID=196821 RepID=UPI0034D56A69
MNIIQEIALAHPLAELLVPTGWQVSKNNFIDASPVLLTGITDEHARFLAAKNFFADDIFMASSERTFDSGLPVTATLDVWCSPLGDEEISPIEYQVSISILKGKKRTALLSRTQSTEDRHHAQRIINAWMSTFTWRVMYEFENSSLPIEHYFPDRPIP